MADNLQPVIVPQTRVFVWDELSGGVATWDVPASILGEADVLVAADTAMAKAVSPSEPDLMDMLVKDEPIAGVKRARGVCSFGLIMLYVPMGPEFELLAFDLAQRDFLFWSV